MSLKAVFHKHLNKISVCSEDDNDLRALRVQCIGTGQDSFRAMIGAPQIFTQHCKFLYTSKVLTSHQNSSAQGEIYSKERKERLIYTDKI